MDRLFFLQQLTAVHINHETRDDPYGGHADKSCDQTAGSKLCSRAYNPFTPKSHKHNHDLATEAYRHGKYGVDNDKSTDV